MSTNRKGPPVKKINDRHTSKTDPEATLVRTKGDTRLRYKVHCSVDESHEIITSCKTTLGALINGFLSLYKRFFKAHNLKLEFCLPFC